MESMPAQESRKVLQDWFFAHVDAKKSKQNLPEKTQAVTQFLDYLWPVALDYYSPLNPVFLAQVTQPSVMSHHSVWFARDGLIPLLWFFNSNPKPKDFKAQLWVSHHFAEWVPEAWRPVTGTYQIQSLLTPSPKAKKLLLLGMVANNYCSLAHLEKQLVALLQELKKSRSSVTEIIAMLPPRHDHLGEGFYGEYSQRIFNKLGSKIRFLSFQEFHDSKSFKGYEIVEFNERLLCADDFGIHHALSKGATLFDWPEKKSHSRDETFLQTSPYHGFRLQNRISGPSLFDSKKGEVRLGQIMLSSANHRFPWPTWFEAWSKVRKS